MKNYKFKISTDSYNIPRTEILKIDFEVNVIENGWKVFLNNDKTNFEVLKFNNCEDEWIEIYHNNDCIKTINHPSTNISIELLNISSVILNHKL